MIRYKSICSERRRAANTCQDTAVAMREAVGDMVAAFTATAHAPCNKENPCMMAEVVPTPALPCVHSALPGDNAPESLLRRSTVRPLL